MTATAAGYYLHWGVVQISLTNFLIIMGMIVVFVLALLIPFPRGRDEDVRPAVPARSGEERPDVRH